MPTNAVRPIRGRDDPQAVRGFNDGDHDITAPVRLRVIDQRRCRRGREQCSEVSRMSDIRDVDGHRHRSLRHRPSTYG